MARNVESQHVAVTQGEIPAREPDIESSLWAKVRSVVLLALGLIVGFLLAWCGKRPEEHVVAAAPSGAISVPSSKQANPSVRIVERSRIMFPFFEADVRKCDAGNFGKGDEIDPNYYDALRHLVRGLQWCGQGEGGVRVDVLGYASQRGFDCDSIERSDELNIALAESRRTKFISRMQDLMAEGAREFPGSSVMFEPTARIPRWRGADATSRLAEMRKNLTFQQDVDKHLGKAPEVFARRVDIVVTKKGRCEPEPTEQLATTVESAR